MRIFLVLASAFLANTVATASETITVFSTHERLNRPYNRTAENFEFNQSMGRAWVELRLIKTLPAKPHIIEREETLRLKVDGLSFDSSQQAVIYSDGEHSAICAIRGRRKLKPTGQCPLESGFKYVEVDNGFELKREKHWYVNLGVQK